MAYTRAELGSRTEEMCYAVELIERLGRDLRQDKLIEEAQEAAGEEGFAKEGGHHVGALSFYFDEAHRLVRVSGSFEPSPCSTPSY